MPSETLVTDDDFQWARKKVSDLVLARVELASEPLAGALVLATVQDALGGDTTPGRLVAIILTLTQLTYGMADFLARAEGASAGIDVEQMTRMVDVLFGDEEYW